MKTLLIDSHHVGYVVHFSQGYLSNSKDDSGVIFGFLSQVLRLAEKFNTNKFMFCWDSKKSHRKIFYPKYKEGRYKNRVELSDEEKERLKSTYKQFDELRIKVLSSLGFNNVFMKAGYEADDLVANLLKVKGEKIIISSDKDYYQLLSKDISMCSVIKSKKVFKESDFISLYGIKPKQWKLAKAIGGCDSDSVKGVTGVSDPAKSTKTMSIAYIKGNLRKGKIFDKIKNSELDGTIKRNLKLVGLPYNNIDLRIKKDRFEYENFIDVFQDLELNYFLTREQKNKWRKIFCHGKF